ncbi:hypothetical protein Ndes2437B_g02811 [Nannochloris sp. 'desiccata']
MQGIRPEAQLVHEISPTAYHAGFMGLIDSYKVMLSDGVGPLQVGIGPATISVHDEETLMKMLPHLYAEWQRQQHLMPPPAIPPSAFPQHGVSVSHNS